MVMSVQFHALVTLSPGERLGGYYKAGEGEVGKRKISATSTIQTLVSKPQSNPHGTLLTKILKLFLHKIPHCHTITLRTHFIYMT
jgi:hypothetical protein